jgi:hypothetical protein
VIIHTCSCGLSFTASEWERLPLCGVQVTDEGFIELRNCPCGSTRSIDLGPVCPICAGDLTMLDGSPCTCCARVECTADLDHPCGTTNGTPCASCRSYEAEMLAEAAREWPAEKARRSYVADMIGAGRAHLLTEDEAAQ